MARIKLGGIVTGISGKIAGTVFQNSRAGTVMKNNITKASKASVRKSINLSLLNSIHAAYNSLTDTQKNTWNIFADFQQIKQKKSKIFFISGRELFIKLNFYRLLYGKSILTAPAFSKCNNLEYTATLTLVGPNLTFTTSRVFVPASEFIILSVSRRFNAGVSNPGSSLRIIPMVTAVGPVNNIASVYLQVFGIAPITGQKLFFKYSSADLLTGLFFSFISDSSIL